MGSFITERIVESTPLIDLAIQGQVAVDAVDRSWLAILCGDGSMLETVGNSNSSNSRSCVGDRRLFCRWQT